MKELDYRGTAPGVVFLVGDVPGEVKGFAREAIQGIVRLRDALKLTRKFGAEAVGYKMRCGIIGALAAIGETEGDYTFELIAYRRRGRIGEL